MAIAFVVLYHVHLPFFTGGFIGVNVFYVLSGYLITSLLLAERKKTGRIRLGRFWGRRLLRLYPGLLAVVVVVGCLWFAVGGYYGSNVDVWTEVLLALTYTANVGRWLFHKSMGVLSQTWSLAMEEQFYLAWPPLLALALARRASRLIIMIALGALVVGFSVLGAVLYEPRNGATPDIYFSPILNAGPLLTGCLLAVAFTSPGFVSALRGRLGRAATWVGALALVSIELAIVSGWQQQRVVFGVVLPVVGIASGLLIAGLVGRESVISRALSVAPVAWFGRNVSYALYLWHIVVFAIIVPLVPGIMGKFAAVLASVVVAIASHYIIELPVARLRRKFVTLPVTHGPRVTIEGQEGSRRHVSAPAADHREPVGVGGHRAP